MVSTFHCRHPDVLTHWLVALVQAFKVPVVTRSQCQIDVPETSATNRLLCVLLSDWVLLAEAGERVPRGHSAIGSDCGQRMGTSVTSVCVLVLALSAD